jgi:hypothetical protein
MKECKSDQMLTLYEILSQGPVERRAIGRTIINQHACCSLPDGAASMAAASATSPDRALASG